MPRPDPPSSGHGPDTPRARDPGPPDRPTRGDGEPTFLPEVRDLLAEFRLGDTASAGGPPNDTADDIEITPSPSARPAFPGYQTLDVLGEGGMGVVYKAREVGLN